MKDKDPIQETQSNREMVASIINDMLAAGIIEEKDASIEITFSDETLRVQLEKTNECDLS